MAQLPTAHSIVGSAASAAVSFSNHFLSEPDATAQNVQESFLLEQFQRLCDSLIGLDDADARVRIIREFRRQLSTLLIGGKLKKPPTKRRRKQENPRFRMIQGVHRENAGGRGSDTDGSEDGDGNMPMKENVPNAIMSRRVVIRLRPNVPKATTVVKDTLELLSSPSLSSNLGPIL